MSVLIVITRQHTPNQKAPNQAKPTNPSQIKTIETVYLQYIVVKNDNQTTTRKRWAKQNLTYE